MKVIILRGIPGSGKSTYAAKLVVQCSVAKQPYENTQAVICSASEYFMQETIDDYDGPVYRFNPRELPSAHAHCLRKYVNELLHGTSSLVIVDNTNISVAEIAPYYALAEAYGHEVKIVTLICKPLLAASRNIHNVPWGKIDQMYRYIRQGLPPFWQQESIHVKEDANA